MAASIDDYLEIYQQACTAYAQQNYEVAATLVDQVVQNLPDDPNSHLLRGHIYYVLQQYDVAKNEYQKVLLLSDDPEILGFAHNGLDSIKQFSALDNNEPIDSTEILGNLLSNEPELTDLGDIGDFDSNSFDLNSFVAEQQEINQIEELSLNSPFDIPSDSMGFNPNLDSSTSASDDPFNLNHQPNGQESKSQVWEEQGELELPAFWQEDISEGSIEQLGENSNLIDKNSTVIPNNISDSAFAEDNLPTSNSWQMPTEFLMKEKSPESSDGSLELHKNTPENKTLLTSKTVLQDEGSKTNNSKSNNQSNLVQSASENWVRPIEKQDKLLEGNSEINHNFIPEEKPRELGNKGGKNNSEIDDNFDFEAFESAFGSEDFPREVSTNSSLNGGNSKSNIEFLDDFDEFDDLGSIPGFEGSIPDFEMTDGESSFGEVAMNSAAMETGGRSLGKFAQSSLGNENSDRDDELFSITGSQEAVPVFTQTDVSKLEPHVSVEQGWLAPIENAPLEKKQWLIAGSVGVVSALVVAVVSCGATTFSPPQQRESIRNTGWAMSLAAGISGFATAGFMGSLSLKQIRRTTQDLQAQFDAVRQGNLHVEATVYSEDELGLLATGFNEMARVIFTTTSEAQRKADEQEEAKENLQRQVIRLLDDVEGAARGDLTVQAEVTADVLGAVADFPSLPLVHRLCVGLHW